MNSFIFGFPVEISNNAGVISLCSGYLFGRSVAWWAEYSNMARQSEFVIQSPARAIEWNERNLAMTCRGKPFTLRSEVTLLPYPSKQASPLPPGWYRQSRERAGRQQHGSELTSCGSMGPCQMGLIASKLFPMKRWSEGRLPCRPNFRSRK